jgi:hypothetical protein
MITFRIDSQSWLEMSQMSAPRLQILLLTVGIVLELAAVIFGSQTTAYIPGGPYAANIAGAGAACGLAIAGGLCLLATALVRGGPQPPT